MARIAILTVSDRVFRGEARDASGEKASRILVEKGHAVCFKRVLPNKSEELTRALLEAEKNCEGAVVIGGTGPSPRDISVDVVERLSWRHLPGFGEIFRWKTYQEKGVLAFYTRAELYLVGEAVVAVLPGSPQAVELGVGLYAEAVDHFLEELHRKSHERHVEP